MAALYTDTLNTPRNASALETSLDAVERSLAQLGAALRDRDAAAVETHAAALHRALAAAVQRFGHAAKQPGGVPQGLRQRLALAGGQVAAQRESLSRATASLDRAIDVLMPTPLPAAVYGQAGVSERASSQGSLHA